VKSEFERVIKCGTRELGYAIYTSDSGEQLEVPFTCKSKACSSCGRKATLDWARKASLELPNIPYSSVLLTMPDSTRSLLKSNPEVLHDLPAIGAGALQDWANRQYMADVPIIAVLHTFSGDFKYKPHLHLLVSRTGLHKNRNQLVEGINYPNDFVLHHWRHDLINHLRNLHTDGLLRSHLTTTELSELLDYEYDIWWKTGVQKVGSSRGYVNYIARYLRRLPIANRNILSFSEGRVKCLVKDTRLGRNVRVEMSAADFLLRLIDQVPSRYTNAVHYFGPIASRNRNSNYILLMALLNQERPKPIPRMTWRSAIVKEFGRDPLIGKDGKTLHWLRNVIPRR
jgi:Putative transposase/Transposase zinc-binding domain